MAQGDVKTFHAAKELAFEGWNLGTDSFKIAFLSTAYASVAASTATPTLSDFTECTGGGGYTAGGNAITVTSSQTGGAYAFALSTDEVWTATAGSPTDIRTAVVVNDTDASDTLLAAVDMTTDGTTPLDLTAGDITISSGNIFTA